MYNSLDWENYISLIMGKGTEIDIISLLSGWWSLQGNDSSCLKRGRKEIKKKVKVWISVVQHFLCTLENTRLKESVGVALHLFWKLKNTKYCIELKWSSCRTLPGWPFDPFKWLTSNFSLQYHTWITHKGHKKKGNDHHLIKSLDC